MGTTSEKLTYLNTTKSNIKNSIELMGTTILSEDTFRSYADKIKNQLKLYLKENSVETLWNNWNKVSGEGTSLTLNNTMEGKMKVDLKGNTYQYSTTGKNICNIDDKTNSSSGLEITSSNQKITITGRNTYTTSHAIIYYYIYPKFVAGETYTISAADGSIANSGIYVQINTNKGALFSLWEGKTTFTVPSDYTNCTAFFIGVSGTATDVNVSFRLQIEQGSTKTDWEAYTGRKPSPNPDYPQDVHVVSGDNTIKVCGINLFDKNTPVSQTFTVSIPTALQHFKDTGEFASGYLDSPQNNQLVTSPIYRTAFMKLQEGLTYTLYPRYDRTGNWNFAQIYILDDNGNTLSYSQRWIEVPYTITPTSQEKYIAFSMRQDSSYQIVDTTQVNIGSQALPYTPYVSQTYPISLGNIELCKIGDYQDSIVKDNGKWYLNKQIGKVVLDGSEPNWRKSGTYQGSFYGDPLPTGAISDYAYLYCNYFKRANINNSSQISSNYTRGTCFIEYGAYGTMDFWYDDGTATVDQWKTWLSNNNPIVYYPLKTPTNEEITDTTLLSQLEALAYSYEGTTNISQVNDDMPFVLDITALKEIS